MQVKRLKILITQPCMGFVKKMAPGVYEGILHAEHEFDYRSSFRFKKLKVANPIRSSSESD